ncbi:MAG: RES family NAD+ phosphorylase [Actinomycetia bacterium]|nr:RES family NAD+ phosphorylase [Actinomycetes bacterium]
MKLPPPPERLRRQLDDTVALAGHTVLWRVHRTVGAHVVAWNQLRFWGPSEARFDPQCPPPRFQASGVAYTALDLPTCLAEVFQDRRVINTTRAAPYLTAWRPTRSLQLLDLTGDWPIRNGASHAINTGPHRVCRAWARAIHSAWDDLDGLWHVSAMTGRPEVTLFAHAATTFPDRPLFSRPLADPGTRGWIVAAAETIGYDVL